jgi:hypothetical protein
MKRPVGVTASAIVAILGSVFAMVVAVGATAALFMPTTKPQPPNATPTIIAGALMLVVLAGVGIWTSVGLYRLRPWARTSILVFSGFLAVGSVFVLLGSMVAPLPPDTSVDTRNALHIAMAVFFGIPFLIAVWWLIQFNTQSTKAAFASQDAERGSSRPVSITILAWLSIFGGVSCVLAILSRQPLFLFGAIFNGWTAGVVYAIYGALSLFIGKGLLDLREEARILGIGWYAFSFLHSAAIALVPALRERMVDYQRTLTPNDQEVAAIAQSMLPNLIFGLAALLSALAIWFLVRNRAAFGRAESA